MKNAQKFTACILLVNFCFFVRFSSAFTCDYKPPENDEILRENLVGDDPKIDDRHRPVRSAPEKMENLRFKVFFGSTIDNMKDVMMKNYVKNKLIPEAVNFWQNVLSVVPRKSAILFYADCTNKSHHDVFTEFNGKPATMCGAYVDCSKRCGNDFQLPDDHFHACYSRPKVGADYAEPSLRKQAGPGVLDADFAFYVMSNASQRCINGTVIAYANYCLLDKETSRPIAGYTNICPKALVGFRRKHVPLLTVVKHEMAHVLGFSKSLYKYYRDEAGKQIPIGKVLENKTFTDWYTPSGLRNHTVLYIKTPHVKKFVQKHFNCSRLIGAQLEDQKGGGTAGSHWEKRLFENEAMAGTYTQSGVISSLTLALFEDSGWYKVDYLYAEPIFWGKNLGCDFAEKSCAYWIATHRKEKKSIAPFCDEFMRAGKRKGKVTCDMWRGSMTVCNLKKYSTPLPPEFQVFDWLPPHVSKNVNLARFGGAVRTADFCPYLRNFVWNDKFGNRLRDSRCSMAENQPPFESNLAMEEFGPYSRCFFYGAGNWTARQCQTVAVTPSFAGCHQFQCTRKLVWLVMNDGQIKYPCFMEGQVITVRRIWKGWAHEGKIICPPCEILCENSESNFKCARPVKSRREIGDGPVNVPCGGGAEVAFLGALLAFCLLCSNLIFYCHTFSA